MGARRQSCVLTVGMATVLALCGIRALAEGERPPAANSAKKRTLKPGQIDLDKSRVYVHVAKKGFGHEHAVEGRIKSGSIDMNVEKGVGEIVFDMTSFSADSDEARKYIELEGTVDEETRDQVTETMRGPQVLDVEEHPTAKFAIKSSKRQDDKTGDVLYLLKGDFTLHGKTRPLELHVERSLEESGEVRLYTEFTILQTDFGIKPYKAAFGAVGVADKLTIWGDLWIGDEKPRRGGAASNREGTKK